MLSPRFTRSFSTCSARWSTGAAGWRGIAAFLARHAPGADPAAFADAWRRRYSPAMEEVRSGRRPFVRLDLLHLENLRATLPEFGIDPADIPHAELDALNLAWRKLDPWPDRFRASRGSSAASSSRPSPTATSA